MITCGPQINLYQITVGFVCSPSVTAWNRKPKNRALSCSAIACSSEDRWDKPQSPSVFFSFTLCRAVLCPILLCPTVFQQWSWILQGPHGTALGMGSFPQAFCRCLHCFTLPQKSFLPLPPFPLPLPPLPLLSSFLIFWILEIWFHQLKASVGINRAVSAPYLASSLHPGC